MRIEITRKIVQSGWDGECAIQSLGLMTPTTLWHVDPTYSNSRPQVYNRLNRLTRPVPLQNQALASKSAFACRPGLRKSMVGVQIFSHVPKIPSKTWWDLQLEQIPFHHPSRQGKGIAKSRIAEQFFNCASSGLHRLQLLFPAAPDKMMSWPIEPRLWITMNPERCSSQVPKKLRDICVLILIRCLLRLLLRCLRLLKQYPKFETTAVKPQ